MMDATVPALFEDFIYPGSFGVTPPFSTYRSRVHQKGGKVLSNLMMFTIRVDVLCTILLRVKSRALQERDGGSGVDYQVTDF